MTTQQGPRPVPGAVALVGAGEYLAVMDTTDRYLLETLGGADHARVALLPTASGLEANGPASWNDLGTKHFHGLGVRDVRPTAIIDRAAAYDPGQLALLQDANFYYFSGGNPQHTIETLRDSPAWEIILTAHQQGAVIAGCSAGAMMMSGHTIAIRQMMAGGKPTLTEALGVVPQVVVFPHFDRMAGFMSQSVFDGLVSLLPVGHVALGIDENTALVRIEPPNSDTPTSPSRWRVMGRQNVTIFARGTAPRKLRVGEEIQL